MRREDWTGYWEMRGMGRIDWENGLGGEEKKKIEQKKKMRRVYNSSIRYNIIVYV